MRGENNDKKNSKVYNVVTVNKESIEGIHSSRKHGPLFHL